MTLLIEEYFSLKHSSQFSIKLPEIRKRIGSKVFTRVGSSYGVGANTFRALSGWPEKPSDVYRTWAESICEKLDLKSLALDLKSKPGFDLWHANLAHSLQIFWKFEQGGNLSFAHQNKLIDLFVKWLSEHDLGSQEVLNHLVQNANCALDSQSLEMLNKCLSGALPISNPSMGHIRTKFTYDFCQLLIEKFTGQCGGTPLLFDYFSWKDSSKKPSLIREK